MMIYAGRDRILREVCKFLRGKKGEISKEGGGRIDGGNRLPLVSNNRVSGLH
jgi:hypothetical protein